MTAKRIKSLLVAVFSLGIVLFSNISFGQDTTHNKETHGEEGKFDVAKTILDHIKDDHSWHLWGHTSISLPVILYSDKGIELFSSHNLVDEHHEPAAYQGNYLYKTFEGKIKVVNAEGSIDEAATKNVWDFSITKNVASLFLTVFILLLVFLTVAKAYKKPGLLQHPKDCNHLWNPLYFS